MGTGSRVVDQFVAATAAQLPEGAAQSACRAAERRNATIAGPEWRIAQLLAERAALRWCAKALASASQEAQAQALTSLGITQSRYLARLIEEDYSESLAADPQLRSCGREAIAALDSAHGLDGVTDRERLREPARHAGHALAACFLGAAIDSIPDEIAAALEVLASDPLPSGSILWE